MNKKNLKLFTALLAVVLVAGVCIFNACKKEELVKKDQNPPDNSTVELTEKSYEEYIEDLIASTGIDIYKLSELDEVKKVAVKQLSIMSITIATSQTKGVLTEEKIIQIQNLGEAIDAANESGNEGEVLRLFESLCAICRTIDGFIFGEDEYGLQSITYAPNEEPVFLPLNQMAIQRDNIVALQYAVTLQNPQFSTLPQTTQIDVLTAIVYVGVQRSIMDAKAPSTPADCIQAAKNIYAAALSLAAVRCGVDLARCAFVGPAAEVCCAIAGARFIVDVAIATVAYRTAIKYC